MSKKVLIIGGGPAGCASVHKLHEIGGWDITLVDNANYLGAGVRTHYYGGHPYTFGPRHFLTKNNKIYNYLDSIVPLRDCGDHQFLSYVEQDNSFYNFPIHMDDVRSMPDAEKILLELENATGVEHSKDFEEYWVNSIGPTLYNKIIKNYTEKMWQVDNAKKIDTFKWSPKGVQIQDGPRAAFHNTVMSAYPIASDGYNKFFDSIVDKCKVKLNTNIEKFDIQNKSIYIESEKYTYDLIISTISPDILFNNCFGELAYIGRDIHLMVFPSENVFPEHVYFLYYANKEQHTRLVEYKKFTNHKDKNTLIGMEVPSSNGRHYPVPIKEQMLVAKKYHDLMPDGVFSLGRAGSYRYLVDIDDCIEQAFELKRIVKEGFDNHHPVPLEQWQKLNDANPNLK
tara:strand:- start:2231 stop:3421 length:1191 start_codon:yes stop_codon:yes gene_type:complete